ncbi:MAG: hypothetical protein QXY99_02050 [Thermoproteota archaeon]
MPETRETFLDSIPSAAKTIARGYSRIVATMAPILGKYWLVIWEGACTD